jgi:AraC family transcriptional regulator, regulatory protein of adaptative response / methylated-DNA-[protein]-cysteine methyltransferase
MNLIYGSFESAFGKYHMLFDENDLYLLMYFNDEQEALNEFTKRFPRSVFVKDQALAEKYGVEINESKLSLKLKPVGSHFQQQVWDALLQIPQGTIVTYTDIALATGKPKAVRAVANAIGANPIAWLIPCHRVIRSDGKLGGYRWGLERKIQMLKSENR